MALSIELKNLECRRGQVVFGAEADCFAAQLFINGEDCGKVSADGDGGEFVYSSQSAFKRLQALCLRLKPQRFYGILFDAHPDLLVGEVLDEMTGQ